jgi:hypothetical protein
MWNTSRLSISRGPHGRIYWYCGLIDRESDAGAAGDFVERCGQPAPGRVAQAVHAGGDREQLANEPVQRGSVAFNGRLELQPLTAPHHSRPVIADRVAENHRAAEIDLPVRRPSAS